MESKGRGIRSRKRTSDGEAAAAAPATPISTAWADFMTEEGMGGATAVSGGSAAGVPETSATVATTTSETTAAASAAKKDDTTDGPRSYKLPLVKEWMTPTTEPTSKKKKTSSKKQGGNVLVQTGTLDSTMIGRNKRALSELYDLVIPTSIMPSLKVSSVIASCNGAHALCIDTSGVAYGWGRNEANQLSQSLPNVVPLPTLLEFSDDLDGVVVDGAVGKSHTILLTSEGTMYAVGGNKSGQCGVRNSTDVVNFRKCVGLENVKIVQVRLFVNAWLS